jgi:hypothetical protein
MYNWYRIFNLTEFLATDLVSRTYTLILEELGEKQVLVTRSNLNSILYEGVFLPINLADANPFAMDGHAVFLDSATQDVYLGIEIDEA